MLLFSVFDKKAGVYQPPFVCPNRVTAFRAITAAIRKEPSNLSEYPSDFALYELGRFDAEGGILVSNTRPEFCEEVVNLIPNQGVLK